jgi:hypothetical protein
VAVPIPAAGVKPGLRLTVMRPVQVADVAGAADASAVARAAMSRPARTR